jgi:hypothetical protein
VVGIAKRFACVKVRQLGLQRLKDGVHMDVKVDGVDITEHVILVTIVLLKIYLYLSFLLLM